MEREQEAERRRYLIEWAHVIERAAHRGIFGGRPIALRETTLVNGPRAGALEIDAGLAIGKLMQQLAADDFALHRQFVPWHFAGEPSVYMTGRCVRLEAGWPDSLAENDIPLQTIGTYPRKGGRWIAGKNEIGATITLGLSDKVPHYLFGGWTGSGKTWAMRAAIAQLAGDEENRLVLIDGKYGDGLGVLGRLPHLVGPVAIHLEAAKSALSWTVIEMRRRYETGDKRRRIVVAFDEIQELTGKGGDPAVVEMVRCLAAQGRGARVHLILGTQHPTQEAFSDPAIKRNLVGRVGLHVEDFKASEVVMGGPFPRADLLLGSGDAFAKVPGAVHRAQLAYIPLHDLEQMGTGAPELPAWPAFDPEVVGTLGNDNNAPYSGAELAVSLVAAHHGNGRPTFLRALENAGLGKPGTERAVRLMNLGRDMFVWLTEHRFELHTASDELTD